MATRLEMKIYPDPILRQKTRLLTRKEITSKDFDQLLLDMELTMHEENGIGLAAPQIGQSIRLAIVKTDEGILPLINPRVVKKSFKKELGEEGCLSIPKVYGTVKRPIQITVEIEDKSGKKVKFKAKGLFARVILHEVDHLEGVLFTDKAKEITDGRALLEEMKNRYNE